MDGLLIVSEVRSFVCSFVGVRSFVCCHSLTVTQRKSKSGRFVHFVRFVRFTSFRFVRFVRSLRSFVRCFLSLSTSTVALELQSGWFGIVLQCRSVAVSRRVFSWWWWWWWLLCSVGSSVRRSSLPWSAVGRSVGGRRSVGHESWRHNSSLLFAGCRRRRCRRCRHCGGSCAFGFSLQLFLRRCIDDCCAMPSLLLRLCD